MKRLQTTFLTILCLFGGYGFHHLNPNDPIITVAFTIGLLGIMLSTTRNGGANS